MRLDSMEITIDSMIPSILIGVIFEHSSMQGEWERGRPCENKISQVGCNMDEKLSCGNMEDRTPATSGSKGKKVDKHFFLICTFCIVVKILGVFNRKYSSKAVT